MSSEILYKRNVVSWKCFDSADTTQIKLLSAVKVFIKYFRKRYEVVVWG